MQVEDFCRLHAHPPFCKHISGFLDSVYEDLLIYSPVVTSSQSADAYFTWRFGQYMCFAEYRLWIQPSTGTISAELGNSHTSWSWWWTNDMTIQNPALPLNAPNADTLATACMSLDVYHHTYCLRLSHPVGLAYLTTFTTVTLGAMVSVPLTCQAVSCMDASEPVGRPHLENFVKLASLEEIEVWDGDGWRCDGVIMANGWTRCPTHSVKSSSSISLSFRVRDQDFAGWISQANHIFKRLHISSSFCDYVLIDTLEIDLWIRQITVNTPTGYLFLCPESHFRTGPASFAWPECPAYWSLDPSGAERLSTEEATHLGFPPFEFESEVAGVYWEDEVYASLRQFHAGKGFDPDSPDVARHLGHALYRLSSDEPTDVDVEAHMAESPAMTDAHASDADLSPGTSASIQEEIPPVSRTFKLLMNL
ncbi:hypothetical protein B0H16DRAFT_1596649 [Mycena metata]|uniref:Uncharacterized protein n=1 Tax=Mycena metata TaxID=1033252 RepID=A0AAD7HNE4_9AGAR|nr:hypothetical protein B0H16DRAFT_1596649 [Mycena metata]